MTTPTSTTKRALTEPPQQQQMNQNPHEPPFDDCPDYTCRGERVCGCGNASYTVKAVSILKKNISRCLPARGK